mmetsp:Transcript_45766/g.99418  ORF Transcript_45766/g.99418 Transcript_45766/m.99418 type:complete len:216 (-) Transcript_45766:301-948(-)
MEAQSFFCGREVGYAAGTSAAIGRSFGSKLFQWLSASNFFSFSSTFTGVTSQEHPAGSTGKAKLHSCWYSSPSLPGSLMFTPTCLSSNSTLTSSLVHFLAKMVIMTWEVLWYHSWRIFGRPLIARLASAAGSGTGAGAAAGFGASVAAGAACAGGRVSSVLALLATRSPKASPRRGRVEPDNSASHLRTQVVAAADSHIEISASKLFLAAANSPR